MNEFELRKELRVRIHQYKDVVYKEETHKSIEELEAEGYAPCGICKPQE